MSAEAHSHQPAKPRRANWLAAGGALLVCVALAYLATGVYSVRANERAVVRRFGRALKMVRTPGLHMGLPYGLEKVDRLRTLETKRVAVGMTLADRALGRSAKPQQSECLTGDHNLIRVAAIVQYRIADPQAYLFNVADVPAVIRGIAASELSRIIAAMKVDHVLTVSRPAIQAQARDATQAALERYGAGVLITSVLLPSRGVAPPSEVADAFRDVTSAREDKHRAINQAEGYANDLAPRARGEKYRILTEAAAYAEAIVEKAHGDKERFEKEALELGTNRRLTLRRLTLETLEQILPRLRKVVLDAGAAKSLDLGLIEPKE